MVNPHSTLFDPLCDTFRRIDQQISIRCFDEVAIGLDEAAGVAGNFHDQFVKLHRHEGIRKAKLCADSVPMFDEANHSWSTPSMTDYPAWDEQLQDILAQFSCQTGTIHRAEAGEQLLLLVTQIGVPDSLIDKISTIPFGKGIAGVAAETRAPVELCNLQQDLGNIAKADARQTGVAGSLAVPIISAHSSEVIGTLGIGKYVPYEFTEAEKKSLTEHAAAIAEQFEHKPG